MSAVINASLTSGDFTVKTERRYHNGAQIWDLFYKNKFLIGGENPEELEKRRENFVANQCKFLKLHGREDDPISWIMYAKESKWSFTSGSEIDTGPDGRTFFHGNIQQYSAAFSYIILDEVLVTEVRSQLASLGFAQKLVVPGRIAIT